MDVQGAALKTQHTLSHRCDYARPSLTEKTLPPLLNSLLNSCAAFPGSQVMSSSERVHANLNPKPPARKREIARNGACPTYHQHRKTNKNLRLAYRGRRKSFLWCTLPRVKFMCEMVVRFRATRCAGTAVLGLSRSDTYSSTVWNSQSVEDEEVREERSRPLCLLIMGTKL